MWRGRRGSARRSRRRSTVDAAALIIALEEPVGEHLEQFARERPEF